MSQLKIARVSALPTPLVANTIYLLQVSDSELQVVTVGNTAADVRSSIIGTDVDGKITASVGALNTTLSQAIANAIVTASNDATAKADAAETDAIAAAAADATTKAAAAQAAAIGVAAGDATTKANAALAAAKTYTDGAVSTAHPPFRGLVPRHAPRQPQEAEAEHEHPQVDPGDQTVAARQRRKRPVAGRDDVEQRQ